MPAAGISEVNGCGQAVIDEILGIVRELVGDVDIGAAEVAVCVGVVLEIPGIGVWERRRGRRRGESERRGGEEERVREEGEKGRE